ncbi:protoporphyrinogen oxidase [Zychaea mexicana]|uniref:protoporphyrinogen oxidase n=1 Tax=Zychaea mexicana TaxID=64656 RepID=UPI0022FEB76E|nr:protoporphyrinogen oxidase [Zychaea mexicana]KAI9490913.1 protoporphyrinogen oxidase [Zychaea mexicana]
MPSVAVLGGGISGLSAAYYLARLSPRATQITLIEGSDRVGGWIRSRRVEPGFHASCPKTSANRNAKSVLFESGPRSLRPVGTSGAVVLELTRDLGLAESLVSVPKTDPSAKNRYIYFDGSINTLPSSLSSLLFHKPPVLKGVIPSILREPFIRSARTGQDDDDESLYSLVSRRLNEHVALDLVGSMVHGIYAGDVKALSARSALRMLYENERVYGSIVKGLLKGGVQVDTFRERGIAARARKEDPDWFGKMESMSVIGFKDGTEMLTERLRSWLEECDNVNIVTGEPVVDVQAQEAESKITTTKQVIYADHTISALPSAALNTVTTSSPLPHLTYNPAVDVAVVNLAYAPDVNLTYDGFGFLTPHPDSRYPVPVPGTLGVVFDSNAMRGQDAEGDDRVKATVMIGGHQWKNAFKAPIEQLDPQEAYQYALKSMKTYLGIDAEPEYSMVNLQAKCIPQYLVGHQQRLGELHQALKMDYGHALSVTGASYWSVSVPDCIKNSRELVEELIVSGALGSKDKIITGLGRSEHSSEDLKDSARLSQSHVNVLMKS